ncbi:DUF2865 domain-containing protein [Rhizobium ruizarguesonis]|uniref:DUF2865 domain-containing protein n=1 Tax=Rhizobium ruizarguesonis TaxID=2081791 RepID=A0AAE4YND8_9HYPH|nr:DUF2865 domain-containing protein [Rhizobium ruizarguesonis]MBY5805911.1 DUF2865 domain-containing protein [Rhizobium leguminosarum]NKJ76624.1 DUF2865 domain-containing protein [Rhizobium leguminosarum bv. viciae]QIO43280.1 DUF2865 domain-containing protein [Rhizobium leguminosarum bv. trifolii]MBC2804087.1 DUF2865 domain-containing protein [Rhizobium ruizarguesonis]MBY5846631.1 DUF2865 domain-containing protein [Rhizobium leguminosarum]
MKRRNLSLALLLAFAAPAAAQTTTICEDLRGRLADLPRSIGNNNGPEVRQYASAMAEQNLELRKVRNELRGNGCTSGSMVVIGGENADYCAELSQSEARMIDNIRYLQDRRDELAGQNGADDGARRELIAALDRNGCNSENFYAPSDRSANEPAPSVEEQAMRTDTFIPLGGGDEVDPRYGVPRAEMLSPVSTMCVRSCDGGFFPISSNATSVDFGRDAQTCAKMCPGIETELFYRDVTSTEASNMISVATGTPYSAMKNAFAYKNRTPGEKSSCACNLTAYYEEMRSKQAVSEPPQQGSITTIRTNPPAKDAAAPQPSVPERPYDPTQNRVRQVGPQFLAGDQGSIDLANPATPGPQPQQQ